MVLAQGCWLAVSSGVVLRHAMCGTVSTLAYGAYPGLCLAAVECFVHFTLFGILTPMVLTQGYWLAVSSGVVLRRPSILPAYGAYPGLLPAVDC